MTTTTTALRVNQENLVKNLRFSFTSATTVLGELMQNARRSGASRVDIDFDEEAGTLAVRDDGGGIEDFQTLLTVAESGWDAETVEREHPFGLGFLSALFACGHLAVESTGGRISAPTADILAFKPVAVSACRPEQAGEPWTTSVVLQGFNPEVGAAQAQAHLEELAAGFPVPVILNGEELPRPCALDAGKAFVQTDVGLACLPGLAEGEDWADSTDALVVYLQGTPVYKSRFWHRCTNPANVVHLDSRFRARLSDRDKLIDEDEALQRVNEALRRAAAARLEALKHTLEPKAFAAGYRTLKLWGCVHLLNDVPAVPDDVLSSIREYPYREGCGDQWYLGPSDPASREDVEAGKVAVASLDSVGEDGAARWMYAWRKGMRVHSGWKQLDPGHWLHGHLLDLDTAEVRVQIVGETHRAYFDGKWVCGDVAFCEKYRLVLGGDAVEIDDEAVYLEKEGLFVVPWKDASGLVVLQACSYYDDNDSFNQAVKDEDEWAFANFVVVNTSADPASAFQRLLPSFAGCPRLFGRRFSVEVGPAGEVASVVEAVPAPRRDAPGVLPDQALREALRIVLALAEAELEAEPFLPVDPAEEEALRRAVEAVKRFAGIEPTGQGARADEAAH